MVRYQDGFSRFRNAKAPRWSFRLGVNAISFSRGASSLVSLGLLTFVCSSVSTDAQCPGLLDNAIDLSGKEGGVHCQFAGRKGFVPT